MRKYGFVEHGYSCCYYCSNLIYTIAHVTTFYYYSLVLLSNVSISDALLRYSFLFMWIIFYVFGIFFDYSTNLRRLQIRLLFRELESWSR